MIDNEIKEFIRKMAIESEKTNELLEELVSLQGSQMQGEIQSLHDWRLQQDAKQEARRGIFNFIIRHWGALAAIIVTAYELLKWGSR